MISILLPEAGKKKAQLLRQLVEQKVLVTSFSQENTIIWNLYFSILQIRYREEQQYEEEIRFWKMK